MKFKYTTLLLVLGLFNFLYAWENKKTHPAVTSKAIETSIIDDYLKTQVGLTNGISTQLYWNFPQNIKTRIDRGEANPNKTTRSISEWLWVGSIIEDEDGRRIAPWRPRHHFYDPTRNAGLDNHTDHPDWDAPFWSSWLPLGQAALSWTITGAALQDPYTNNEKWAAARSTFYDSLRNSTKSVREAQLAEVLLNIGCVLHMLEDMGVPAHTRNDFLFGHYRSAYKWDWGNPFESWVEDRVIDNNGMSLWSGTGPVVFNKLAKYFDADEYAGNYLGDGILPPEDLWGLAECTNYQFLSLSTVFGCSGVKYQFPHPAKEHTTSLAEYGKIGDTVFQKIYFNGSNYGLHHLVRRSYTHYKKSVWGGDVAVVDSTNTPDDVNVFIDYAEVTIPRTIDYATGLANYFFRGRLNVEPNWADPNIVELVITNDSNNSGIPQTLKGGSFELYWDDTNDTRTQIDPNNITFIPGWTPASTLPNDDGVTELSAQFAPPAENVKRYVVVYKGSICENPLDPDPDDPNAIAVGTVALGYEIVAWTQDPARGDKYGQISNVPEGSDFVTVAAGKYHCLALKSDGSLAAWGYNNHGECNIPDGTDFTAIAAGTYHSLALQSDGTVKAWGNNNNGQTQIYAGAVGKVHVAVAASANYSFLLRDDEVLIAWGGGDWLEPGIPRYHYRQPDSNDFIAIAAGTDHIMALTSNGKVFDWEWPTGDFSFDYFSIPVPDGVVFTDAVAAGYKFSLSLKVPQ